MKIEKFIHKNVKSDGTVITKPMIRMSAGEGCGVKDCHCSDGYWISIGSGRTLEGIIEGIIVRFDDKKEFERFMKTHEVIGG